jgi:hypothetical protein
MTGRFFTLPRVLGALLLGLLSFSRGLHRQDVADHFLEC